MGSGIQIFLLYSCISLSVEYNSNTRYRLLRVQTVFLWPLKSVTSLSDDVQFTPTHAGAFRLLVINTLSMKCVMLIKNNAKHMGKLIVIQPGHKHTKL